MILDRLPLAEAGGAVLAHTQRLPAGVLRKGTVLDAPKLAVLRAAGFDSVVAARLDPGDVNEDVSADRLASALLEAVGAGGGITRSRASTGRVNLFAAAAGLFRADASRIDRLNLVDESLTLGTLPDAAPVAAGDMLATIKVIPFAVPGAVLARAEAVAREAALLTLDPFRPLRTGLVLTELAGIKESVLAGTINATEARVTGLSGSLLAPRRTAHETAAIAAALRLLLDEGAELLLIAGASAVVDRADVAPAAIVQAGGEILHFGMPVDPGNLICLGAMGAVPALVLPGCARSPKLNGIDFVLWRLFAGLPVSGRDLAAMGVGGLLQDSAARPMPRARAGRNPQPGIGSQGGSNPDGGSEPSGGVESAAPRNSGVQGPDIQDHRTGADHSDARPAAATDAPGS